MDEAVLELQEIELERTVNKYKAEESETMSEQIINEQTVENNTPNAEQTMTEQATSFNPATFNGDYNSLNSDQVSEVVRARKAGRAAELNMSEDELNSFLRSSGKKSDKVARLKFDDHVQAANQSFKPVVGITGTMMEIPLSNLQVSPINDRSESDYIDPDLYNSIRLSGGLTDNPSVFKATDVDPSAPDDVYYILSGNRRTVNLKRYVEQELGLDLSTYTQLCSVRQYDGKSWQNEVQLERETVRANTTARGMTTVDMVNWVKRNAGRLSGKDMARDLNIQQTQVSVLKKMGSVLPQVILDRLEASDKMKRLEQLDNYQLGDLGVKFEIVDGKRVIKNIPQVNVLAMTHLFPRVPGKSADADKVAAYTDTVSKLQLLITSDEVLQAAQDMQGSQFEKFIKQTVADAGLTKKKRKNPTPKKVVETPSEPVVEAGSTDDVTQQASEPVETPKPKKRQQKGVEVPMENGPSAVFGAIEFAQKLETREISFLLPAEEMFAHLLRQGKVDIVQAILNEFGDDTTGI